MKTKDVKTTLELECSECGAIVDAGCNCDMPYFPAGTRAAKAIEDNPEKSDRAIAAEIGVSQPTVSRARKSGDTNVSPEKRTGKDGKSYPAKQKPRTIVRVDEVVQVSNVRYVPAAGPTTSESEKALAGFKSAIEHWWPKLNRKHRQEASLFFMNLYTKSKSKTIEQVSAFAEKQDATEH